jgi:positive regulator of sigma E activity
MMMMGQRVVIAIIEYDMLLQTSSFVYKTYLLTV